MSAAKHTLGPWDCGKASDGTWYIHATDALGFRPAWTPFGCIAAVRPTPASEADAMLIAAAPALADALEEALRLLRDADTSLGNFTEEDLPKAYAALRAAGRLP